MLIVNADDLGGYREASDAIEKCFDAGAITSATFMVGMTDSARAARLARKRGWPIGLHLNLTQPFDDPNASRDRIDRHDRICAYFATLRRRRLWTEWRPRTRRMVADEIKAQLGEFEAMFDATPDHIDSHHHAHTATVVLEQLPKKIPLRRTASRRGISIARRFRSTDRFMSFPEIDAAVAAAEKHSVELMVHPSFEHELPILLSDAWIAAVARADTGSFADLV